MVLVLSVKQFCLPEISSIIYCFFLLTQQNPQTAKIIRRGNFSPHVNPFLPCKAAFPSQRLLQKDHPRPPISLQTPQRLFGLQDHPKTAQVCGPASLGSWNGHTRADCQREAEGSCHFPKDFPFAVCLEGHTAVSQTQEELEACRDHCLHPTCPMEGSSPVD